MNVKKNVYKLGFFYFFIITLFLCSFNNFSTIKSCRAFETNTIFVGGTGDKNYSKIQDAIDNSKENDTVIVSDGIYYENVVINKSINLIGLNKNNVFINGTDDLYVFLIKSSYVNISGFSIQGGKIGIFVSGPEFLFNNFSGNNISDNNEGIRLVNTSDNKIFDNVFQSRSDLGIVFYDSCYNIISGNLFLSNGKAIYLNKWSDYNIIWKNNLSENNLGISLDFSFNNLVTENYIGKNDYGIYLSNSNNNNVTNNNIEFNSECGIFSSNSDDNVISPNIFLKNNQDVKLDTKPPEIKAPGFEILLFFCCVIFVYMFKKYV